MCSLRNQGLLHESFEISSNTMAKWSRNWRQTPSNRLHLSKSFKTFQHQYFESETCRNAPIHAKTWAQAARTIEVQFPFLHQLRQEVSQLLFTQCVSRFHHEPEERGIACIIVYNRCLWQQTSPSKTPRVENYEAQISIERATSHQHLHCFEHSRLQMSLHIGNPGEFHIKENPQSRVASTSGY